MRVGKLFGRDMFRGSNETRRNVSEIKRVWEPREFRFRLRDLSRLIMFRTSFEKQLLLMMI